MKASDITTLEDTFRTMWNKKKLPQGGMAEAWYTTVIKWSEHNGDEFIPEDVRSKEELCLNPVLAKQYVDALIKVCNEIGANLTIHQKAMLLVTATLKEREAALQEVFGRGR